MALKLAKKAADLQEDNAIVHLSLAEVYRGLKRWSEAESSIKRGLALDPNQPSLITCYKEIQVPILKERGMMLMQESQVLIPLPVFVLSNFIVTLTRNGARVQQMDEALAVFSEALALNTATGEDKYWLLTQRFRIYKSKLDMISAADEAEQCIQENPSLIEGYERYCDALIAIGDFDSARSYAQVISPLDTLPLHK